MIRTSPSISALVGALSLVSESTTTLATPAAPAATGTATDMAVLDGIADDYLRLTLEIGTHEDGYIDAYYGPTALGEAARAAPRDKAALLAATRTLLARTNHSAAVLTDPLARRRAAFLRAQLIAAETRLMMMQGTRFAFAEEAERLFGIRPVLKALAVYDRELAKVEALAPDDGPLATRVEAYLDRFTVPSDRLRPVFDEAIALCRSRSAAHIAMPAGESSGWSSSPARAGAAIITIRAAITA